MRTHQLSLNKPVGLDIFNLMADALAPPLPGRDATTRRDARATEAPAETPRRSAGPNPIPGMHGKTRFALVECGLWLGIAFVGASSVTAGALQLFTGDVRPLSALALAVGGGIAAGISGWRARTVLETADRAARGTVSS